MVLPSRRVLQRFAGIPMSDSSRAICTTSVRISVAVDGRPAGRCDRFCKAAIGIPLPFCVVLGSVVTGSRWSDAADIEGHLLAGRAGTVPGRRLRHLFPMSFRDFLAATRPELVRPEAPLPSELQSPTVAATLDEIAFDVDAYDLAWQDYLTVGGFPRAVFEHVTDGAVSDAYLRDLPAGSDETCTTTVHLIRCRCSSTPSHGDRPARSTSLQRRRTSATPPTSSVDASHAWCRASLRSAPATQRQRSNGSWCAKQALPR